MTFPYIYDYWIRLTQIGLAGSFWVNLNLNDFFLIISVIESIISIIESIISLNIF